MASKITNTILLDSVTKQIDLNGADDIRVALVMTNTTVDTEVDKATNGDYTDVDEFDGANYTAGGKTLASEAAAIDVANVRVEFDFEDLTWTALGNGTRAIQGILIYKFVTNFNSSIPIAFVEFAVNQNPGGSDFTVKPGAEGVIHIKQAA